jgi:hypothetical protein
MSSLSEQSSQTVDRFLEIENPEQFASMFQAYMSTVASPEWRRDPTNIRNVNTITNMILGGGFSAPQRSTISAEAFIRENTTPCERKDGTCTICLDDFSVNDSDEVFKKAVSLQCGHVFCRNCIRDWTRQSLARNDNLTCPNCRSSTKNTTNV